MLNIFSKKVEAESEQEGSERNKRGEEEEGGVVAVVVMGGGGVKHLMLTQIMIIMLAGSERLDTSIVYESPQSCAQFPLL